MKCESTLIGAALPNIPWEDRPSECADVVWRSRANPIIPRNLLPGFSNSIFNSAVVPYGRGYCGIFRVESRGGGSALFFGNSDDGRVWNINSEAIRFATSPYGKNPIAWGYDPRVTKIGNKYYITWCNDFHGPTIGLGWTADFKKFHQMENAFIPHNRNGVLFPEKINGHYVMLSRPSDPRHTTFGDIFISQSRDLAYWGKHHFVMATKGGWQCVKIGPGPVPIKTTQGWLMIYHGVNLTCNGMIYRMGAALLDLNEPWRVLYRTSGFLLAPQEIYECAGDVPNVVFPVATLQDAATGRIAIYYGAADTCTCLAFCQVDKLIKYIKTHSEL
jgi:beta-1,4-mannooligosaccharide/beta-1,4-mannosyl-N-acetylglucosamine phosphorylase